MCSARASSVRISVFPVRLLAFEKSKECSVAAFGDRHRRLKDNCDPFVSRVSGHELDRRSERHSLFPRPNFR